MHAAEMVFIIIFAIIVIGFILVYGGGTIMDVFCIGNIAATDKSIKDMEHIVQEVYHFAEGSSQVFQLNLPRSVKICFINSSSPESNIIKGWKPDPVIEDIIKTEGYNIWIYYNCGNRDTGFKINYLSTSENFCITGSNKLYLENRGTYITVEK